MYFETAEGLKTYINRIIVEPDEQLMILAGYKSADEVSEVMEFLNEKGINFFGGIYPGLLTGKNNKPYGFIVERFNPVFSSLVLPHMMRFNKDPATMKGYTALVLVDGLSPHMKALIDTLFKKMGTYVNYLGGGAGFYDLNQRPCIFDNKGIYQDVLYVCVIPSPCFSGVKHGWRKLMGPFSVDRSIDNVLISLDGDNAFEVYKEVIEAEEHITLFKEDFFAIAKDHPFGIVQEDGSIIVRDPIGLNDNYEIICVADIPVDSQVYVLKGDVDSLLSSSLEITEYCTENAPDYHFPLLFNCISRAMFMEDKFEEELANIQNKLKPIVQGALSIGEIASKSNGEIVIHNKSTVLGLIGK